MGMHKSNSKKPRGAHSIGLQAGGAQGQGSAFPSSSKLERDTKVRVDGVNNPHGSKGSIMRRGDQRDRQPQK